MSNYPLTDLIELEELDTHLFRGQNYPSGWGQVFGGQVVAQALNAARRSVPDDRFLHSMHGYFILSGKLDRPIVYHVDPIRDGRSFNTRRVVAYQNGKAIFNLSSSFNVNEPGLDHQILMPEVPAYHDLISDRQWAQQNIDRLPTLFRSYLTDRYVEFRPTEVVDLDNLKKTKPIRNIWLKVEEKLADDSAIHKEALAFASDYNLMSTALFPHIGEFQADKMQFASLDHAMWFHRRFRADEWLLYAVDSPSASNSRGFNRGNFFNEKGVLVASVVQEGLMRRRKQGGN